MAHVSINMEDMPIEILEFTPVNPLISKCQIKVCYVGDEPNRNHSIITKEVAKDLAVSIPGCPIVGYFNEDKEDFEEHNRIIEIANGKFKVKDTTRPYGFVPTDAKVWFQWFEDDGVAHEYLMTEGYIWTGQYPEAMRVVTKGNNQSMELDENTLDASWTKDNNGNPQFFIINEAIMSKLCILGEDVEPCFEGASITNVQFSFEDDFKQKLFSLMEKMQEILSNEGGTPVFNKYAVEIGGTLWNAVYEYLWNDFTKEDDTVCPKYTIYGFYTEGDQKFAILRNNQDLVFSRLNFSFDEEENFVPADELIVMLDENLNLLSEESQFALEEVEAYETTFAQSKKKIVEENAVDAEAEAISEEEESTAELATAKYNLEEVSEYVELKALYEELQTTLNEAQETINSLNATIEQLTTANNELVEFKKVIDRDKKMDLIKNTFYMLSDDLKKDCVDNIDTYSYDEIEAKLSVICVRNKVSFDLDKPIVEDKQDDVTTFNLDNIDGDNSGIPAWVARVQEVAKEKNI